MYLLDFFRGFARPPHTADITNEEAINKTHAFIAGLEWADYSPKITHGMVTHGASRYYQTPSCPKLYQEGLCVGKCPYYDEKGM
jgi:hypothetical protein